MNNVNWEEIVKLSQRILYLLGEQPDYVGKIEMNFFKGGLSNVNGTKSFKKPQP